MSNTDNPASSSSVEDVDVVIIGYGGAGASAAITCHDAGLRVALLESSAVPGGNTRASGGSLRPVDDIDGALSYLSALSHGETPDEMLRTFLQHTPETLSWLESLGASLVPMDGAAIAGAFPRIQSVSYPGAAAGSSLPARLRVDDEPGVSGGESLWRVLEAAVAARNISVHLGARATRIESTPDAGDAGRIVVAEHPDGEIRLRARRAVVIATGGFQHDAALVADWLGHPLKSFGPPLNRGDGLRLAQSLGASLWHMAAHAVTLGYPKTTHPLPVRHQSPDAGFVYVDLQGRRFIDETGTDFHALPMSLLDTDVRSGSYMRLPSWFVFDETTRTAGPIANASLTFGGLDWSADNSAEIADGSILTAATLEELAQKMGVDDANLAETIATYNAAAASGDRDEFGRDERRALDHGPFYAIQVEPVLVNTQGGPKRDERGRVLDSYGSPIEGLYGAGELGSIWGHFYPGAGNLTEALVSGRRAAMSITESQA